MSGIGPTDERPAPKQWTAESVEAMNSSFYPLCESGPLCPLLDDENLLFEFYIGGNLRQEVKRFCKIHRWSGRPQSSYAMTDDALRKLLRSMCNSPEARRMLKSSGESIALHNAIWAWLSNSNRVLFKKVESSCHKDKSGKVFISPKELGVLLDVPGDVNAPDIARSKIFLSLAFAMLENEFRSAHVAELLNRVPELAVGLGLTPQACERSEHTEPTRDHLAEPSPEPVIETKFPAAVTGRTDVHASTSGDCISYVSQIYTKVKPLRESAEKFAGGVAELSNIDKISAFEISGIVERTLVSLNESSKNIQELSRHFLDSLTVPCTHPAELGCELRGYLERIKSKPPETILDLDRILETMQKKYNDLHAKAVAARMEIPQLKSEASSLSKLLHLPDSGTKIPVEMEFPCEVLEAHSAQKRIVTELRQQIAAESRRRSEELIGDIERVRIQYDLGANSNMKECFELYTALRTLIASVVDMADIQECENRLEALKARCRAAEQYDHHKLAQKLQKEPESFPVFLDLCHSFVDQGAPEVAYLLLAVRQQFHPFEEIAEYQDRAISLLLETACASVVNQLPVPIMWESLCVQPWLLSSERSDIESPDLHECLVVALIGAALGGREEQASAMLAKFGALDLGRQRFPKTLDEVLRAVVACQSIRIIKPDQIDQIRDQEIQLRESLAHEGGRYRHIQCGKAHYYASFENATIFPALDSLWLAISSDLRAHLFDAAHARVDRIRINEWYTELVRNSGKPVDEHPLFSVKIREFMREYVTRLQDYVADYQKVWGGSQIVIVQSKLIEALDQWVGAQKSRKAVAELISLTLMHHAAINSSPSHQFWHAISLCPAVVMRCPHFVTWLCAQQEPTPDAQLEQSILADLAIDWPTSEVVHVLEADSAWEQLCAVSAPNGLPSDPGWKINLERERAEVVSQRGTVEAVMDARALAIFDACVKGGRLVAARNILHLCDQRTGEERAHLIRQVTLFVDDRLRALNDIKELAHAANMPEQWLETVCNLAAKAEMRFRRLKRTDEPREFMLEQQTRLAKAVEALQFLVEQHSSVFDEVEHLLRTVEPQQNSMPITLADKERAKSRCPDLHGAWNILARAEGSGEEIRRAWFRFAKVLLKECNLYHYEKDATNRFAVVPRIKYPFEVLETEFYKPQSEFLKRRVRLYLYRHRDVDIQALQRLESELSGEDAAAWLHIVFAPQGFDKIQRYFKYDMRFKNFLLVDEEFLCRVSLSEKHEVPLRQALHASVTDLANSSPFVAQGYCHQNNNIYVGRTEVLQELLNTPQAMIWGGRRIGKTSVLHALENSLRRRDYKVAYVYVDIDDVDNPDLAVAQKICATLNLPLVQTIPEFERQIASLRATGVRLAFLIDEVDEYIKKSRAAHGDAFPLATALRQVVNEDSAKDTRLVYSGYHQLYYEAKLDREKRRVGHPFFNTGQEVPIGNLLIDDVKDLVTAGFEDMLDIGVSPEVPSLIFRRASGHPAFVQQFCRCLLERIATRRARGTRVTIVPDDVEAVYAANASGEGGGEPFIFYVNETLGYNLSHLGRAIMLAICHSLGSTKEANSSNPFFSIEKVSQELNEWCAIVGVPPPENLHLRQTVELLVMTNMLTQNMQDHEMFQVTYPTYIDILRRLDKLGRTEIGQSLYKYNEEERNEGVLL